MSTSSKKAGSRPTRPSPKGNDGDDALASVVSSNGTDGLPAAVAQAHKRGWHVIPQMLEWDDKRPCFKWKEFQTRKPAKRELRRWALDYPSCAWAVITGQVSGVIVFDFDGKDGLRTMKRLGLEPYLHTPRGGAHVYCYAPSWKVRGGARQWPDEFPNMDLRADGQLATFYGKNHLRGMSYVAADDAHIYHYDDLRAELQRLLADRKWQKPKPPTPLPDGFKDYAGDDELLAEALGIVDGGGTRNQAGFHLACQLRDERYSEDDALGVMFRFVEAVGDAGDHPYTEQEAYNSLQSALSVEPREPRGLGKYKFGDGFRNTDLGNAERLIARHGELIRYVPPAKHWIVWNGQRWAPDDDGEVHRLAKETIRNILHVAAEVEDNADLLKWAKASESKARMRDAVDMAQKEAGVPIMLDELDVNPWLLNVNNGTIDLRTGELLEPRKGDLITRLAPVDYDPDAKCPTWDKFLKRILPSKDLRAFMQRMVGYSLTGDAARRVFPVCYGIGANGKTTLLEVIAEILGDYAQQAPPDFLMRKRSTGGASPELARLHGARFVTISETGEGRKLDESLVKQLTGGDRIAARTLYKDYGEFVPVAKLWLITNHKPEVSDTGLAMWDRIRLIPFTVTIPPKDQDRHFKETLLREDQGILRWAVEGCLAWQRDGLNEPAEVMAATEDYRKEQDWLSDFLDDRCVVGPEKKVHSDELFTAYLAWANRQGIKYPLTQKKFGGALGDRGFQRKRWGKPRRWGWLGLTVRKKKASEVRVKGQAPTGGAS